MKKILIATVASAALLFAGAASASDATAVSGANSEANSGSVSSVNSNPTANATNGAANSSNEQNITSNNNIPKHQDIATVPTTYAPALTTTLTETCMGSTSLGVSVLGWGATGGTTWNDKECVNRLNARELNSMGYRAEACLVLRNDPIIEAAFEKTGSACTEPPPPTQMQAPAQPVFVPANNPPPPAPQVPANNGERG